MNVLPCKGLEGLGAQAVTTQLQKCRHGCRSFLLSELDCLSAAGLETRVWNLVLLPARRRFPIFSIAFRDQCRVTKIEEDYVGSSPRLLHSLHYSVAGLVTSVELSRAGSGILVSAVEMSLLAVALTVWPRDRYERCRFLSNL